MKKIYLVIPACLIVLGLFLYFVVPVLTIGDNHLIGDNIDYISVNKVNDTIAFPVRSESFSGIIFTDRSLNEIQRLPILEYPINCKYSNDCSILLVTVWAPPPIFPGHEFDENGSLAIIDTTNWSIRYCTLPSYPTELCVTNDNEYAYVTCGYYQDFYPYARLLKVDLVNCGIENQIDFGKPGFNCVIMNNDETKLYFDAKEIKYENDAENEWKVYQIGKSTIRVINKSTFQLVKDIYVDRGISQMINGPDNLIYAAHRGTRPENDSSITLISTESDSVVNDGEIKINNTSCYELIYDGQNGYLYANPLILSDYYDADNYLHTDWLPTNKVIRFLISDYSYTWIEVAPEEIGAIALSSDGSRIYGAAVAPDSQKVYYVDLE